MRNMKKYRWTIRLRLFICKGEQRFVWIAREAKCCCESGLCFYTRLLKRQHLLFERTAMAL